MLLSHLRSSITKCSQRGTTTLSALNSSSQKSMYSTFRRYNQREQEEDEDEYDQSEDVDEQQEEEEIVYEAKPKIPQPSKSDINKLFGIKVHQDIDIEATIKASKTKIMAMPFEYSYDNFYKSKRSTKKGITKKNAHLKAFGVVPYHVPESMFKEKRPSIPLSEINKNVKSQSQ
ncbi:hypothetical protein DFA_10867 [Cavenderia fasciculata]|uniref:Uncharacterized protein n=1 Tax=Cavenderia fasciculata TaxID=261658 RepID=F4QBM1_CACFS|nr:uncharacterized protein DFA_10867 [Cavenderia fasciculata]EGG14609.1 hypothetical protein DFA_10867 [Cavenderia fasciculata]|eukprot:XP_004351117.1 hypothetical protein DFA_10867 [Cavenderia fasciculata]